METILGVSVNALKVRTYRAREMFRSLISEKEQADEKHGRQIH